jgi:uncharacterized protein involved in exopolysaccharide biosynthesis
MMGAGMEPRGGYMGSLKGYAKRVAKLREAMEATKEQWEDQIAELDFQEKAEVKSLEKKKESLEAKIERLDEAISTLESLEMELEA